MSLIVLDGSTFFISDLNGDVHASHHEGFFFEDVRHLSRWQLRANGKPLELLTGRSVDYYSCRVVGSVSGEPGVSLRRDRFVTDGFHEDVVVENSTMKAREVRLELSFGSDFADVMEAQRQGTVRAGRRSSELGRRTVTLACERRRHRRATQLTFSRIGKLTHERVVFELHLQPRETWQLCVDVRPIADRRRARTLLRCGSFGRSEPKMRIGVKEWVEAAPVLECGEDAVERVYHQSLLDLAALRLRPSPGVEWALPAGGVPWFMTVFGRDSMVASFEALPFQPHLAEATLEVLAGLQAADWDNFADAEPGKLPHEVRRGILSALGEHPGVYYGAHDGPPLFLILLDEYGRWTGDDDLVRRLEPAARAALAWIEGPGDPDGDGYLEYRSRSRSRFALSNHCWRDSDDAIVFADGRRAEPPLATSDIQGYAYDARLRLARLAREVYDDPELAERLERDAAALRERFNRDYWSSNRGHYVLALDRDKRQVDSLTSNLGHLLWSGIVDERRVASTARLLLSDVLFTGYGIRSMSADDVGYDPLAYHRGTVWPHDTAIAAAGLRRQGLVDEAARICLALLDAAVAFDYSLPELFGGFQRDAAGVPVPYPNALKPQAWAAAAPLLAVRTLLGLEVVDGRVVARPHVPERIHPLRLRGLQVRGSERDVSG